MGEFITPEDMKVNAIVPHVGQLATQVLDDTLILPAERAIERECVLHLNTDKEPWHWAARFDVEPRLRDQYRSDYRLAVILVVNRWAANPLAVASESRRGASVVYGRRFPSEARTLMSRWGRPRRLVR